MREGLSLIVKVVAIAIVLVLLTLLVNITRGILARFAKHSALHAVSGLPRTSLIAGNLHELYDTGGLPHLQALSQYGGIAKVHGLFGVRRVKDIFTFD